MSTFSNLDELLLHREYIIDELYANYSFEECFATIPFEEYSSLTLDGFALALYNNFDYYWVVPFFNPSVDLSELGIKKYANSGEFIKGKLHEVYVNKLGKSSYTSEQIGKVFDAYNEYSKKEIVVPKRTYIVDIEKFINKKYEKLNNG